MIDLNHGPCIYKRISGCGSGTEYFAVTPQGDLYPCHQFVGEPEYLMGNIFDGIEKRRYQDEFKMCNVYAREDCRVAGLSYIVAVAVRLMALSLPAISEVFTSSVVSSSRNAWNAR